MKSIGGLLVLLGAGSFVLHFMDQEFRLLSWVDNWGVGAGNGIRIGMIVVGGILWYVGHSNEAKAESPQA